MAALRPNGEGAIMLAVAKFIFWICATVTYLHDPESPKGSFLNDVCKLMNNLANSHLIC